MNIKSRVSKLEQYANDGPSNRPPAIELWGTRGDGSRYRITTWQELMDADQAGHLVNSLEWQQFVMYANAADTIQAQAANHPEDADLQRLARMSELSQKIVGGEQ